MRKSKIINIKAVKMEG